jgi:hypothetical protein
MHQEKGAIDMTTQRIKFSSQADEKVLKQARKLAETQGRQFQSILEDALIEYLERNQTERPRAHVMEAFGLSMAEFDELYKKLAQ